MSKDRREPEYPAELESQFILRLPEEPAGELKQLLQSGDNMKNRLFIQMDQDMRKGEVRFDHRTMHGKIVDLPTVVESMKTIDNKSFYKTADICQMMVCKVEPDQSVEEETPVKNKKKDPYKVDKKFLFPHGLTPPTKNVRKRRFRKTLRKKCAEAPQIEKEVKRLLRADNEAESVTFEIVNEDDEQIPHPKPDLRNEPSTSKAGNAKPEKKAKGRTSKQATAAAAKRAEIASTSKQTVSNVVDIFGGAVSDSDLEDNDDAKVVFPGMQDMPESQPLLGMSDVPKIEQIEFNMDSQMFELPGDDVQSNRNYENPSTFENKLELSFFDEEQSRDSRDSMTVRIEQVKIELEELKERRKRTQNEIAGMENLTLRQRFQNTLHTLNQEVMFKEMEYQGLLTLQNSEDI